MSARESAEALRAGLRLWRARIETCRTSRAGGWFSINVDTGEAGLVLCRPWNALRRRNGYARLGRCLPPKMPLRRVPPPRCRPRADRGAAEAVHDILRGRR